MRPTRRRFCAGAAAATTALLAGCEELGLTAPPIEEVKAEATSPGYEDLLRNVSDYKGEYVHYRDVGISNTLPDSGGDEYLINHGSGSIGQSNLLYGLWDGDPFREGDTVELWGEVTGTREVDLMTGLGQQLPEVKIYELTLM